MPNLSLLKSSKAMCWLLSTDIGAALLHAFTVDALHGFLQRVFHLLGLQEMLSQANWTKGTSAVTVGGDINPRYK